MLVGPPAYLPISPSYLLTEVGLVILGLGNAAICTSSFARVQGANDDSAQSATLCGLWTAAYALGNFLGPSVGGVMVAQFSFYHTTPILQVLMCWDRINISLFFFTAILVSNVVQLSVRFTGLGCGDAAD